MLGINTLEYLNLDQGLDLGLSPIERAAKKLSRTHAAWLRRAETALRGSKKFIKFLEGEFEHLPPREWEKIIEEFMPALLQANPGVPRKALEELLVAAEGAAK